MTEPMTIDQRVALALTTTMQAAAAVSQTFAALTGIGGDAPELARLAERQVESQTDIAGRILELSEALAAGTVRIVDEAALVHEVARALTPAGGDWEQQISSAQGLVLRLWKTTGVLR
ncbi:hypothetical protein [Curtobacterium sp. MCBA15_004]|uniref:hypothetical protein n=1 Tax=Curtobacterium sp. MCBA15_004 TaxID=1898733 RepID=UPI0008DD95B1|nr:hypothetical protein [Curtobacterium sp. MCBA15_004]WIA96430.1 hypothetical protein QOL16_15230 [Curtobacterium sp. MCBA15_004]